MTGQEKLIKTTWGVGKSKWLKVLCNDLKAKCWRKKKKLVTFITRVINVTADVKSKTKECGY